MSNNARLVKVPADEAADEEALARRMRDEGLFLGKCGDALHWILAGGDSFEESAVSGGAPVLDVDHGSAPPPQLVTPDEVRASRPSSTR